MDRPEDRELEPDRDVAEADAVVEEHETHASTGGAAAAGAVTGGVIGLAGGPIGAAIGAVGGAIVGAAAERMMHGDEERDVETTPVAATDADIVATDSVTRIERERDRDIEPRV